MKRYATMLSIAGSDSSGGAGIQADIKTASALGVYAMTAITAITVQNTLGVEAVQDIRPDIVAGQIDVVFSDIPPLATKTGMLFSSDIVDTVARCLAKNKAPNIVVDPVMVSTSGSQLISDDAIDTMVTRLFPIADIVTPNYAEAVRITGLTVPEEQALRFHELGVKAVLLKGGDSPDDGDDCKTDYLSIAGKGIERLRGRNISTRNTHGTGCTLSSAIASFLALGHRLDEAVRLAKAYITDALRHGADINIGHGHGPVNHLYQPHNLYIIEQ
ncbi:MAG: bifunctional hydroxymethylpyrimidine kinase/phosphomethylpyrimidine kinase [Pseudoflavonifractor sp.]|nr:bifunctional hydroxymethylpyrimidine kinase/phosphomethylpyrimidine kinase [Pseudoflavonifractor sp.]